MPPENTLLSSQKPTEFSPHTISLRLILIWHSHLCQSLESDVFLQISVRFSPLPKRAACHPPLMHLTAPVNTNARLVMARFSQSPSSMRWIMLYFNAHVRPNGSEHPPKLIYAYLFPFCEHVKLISFFLCPRALQWVNRNIHFPSDFRGRSFQVCYRLDLMVSLEPQLFRNVVTVQRERDGDTCSRVAKVRNSWAYKNS